MQLRCFSNIDNFLCIAFEKDFLDESVQLKRTSVTVTVYIFLLWQRLLIIFSLIR